MSKLPDPESMIRKQDRGCCVPPVKEFLDKLRELKISGKTLQSHRVIAETLSEAGYEVTAHQVGSHLRGH